MFTCLSPQMTAGETALALLDGMHPALAADHGLDALAFKAAFADVVGLLQHFSMPGVLRQALGRRGAVRSVSTVIGELAARVGAGSGNGGALRDSTGSP